MSTTAAVPAALLDAASARFRPAGRFAYHFARGKLGHDAVFGALLALDCLPPAPRWLDLGCGQGSLFAWLLAAQQLHASGDWPAAQPAPPQPVQLHGIELMAQDVQRARRAFGTDHPSVRIEQGDMTKAALGPCDVVTILDALHYVAPCQQRQVLTRIHAALAPGGVFITRVGDADAGLPFWCSLWVDRLASGLRRYRQPRHCRSLSDWRALLHEVGFAVSSQPMSGALAFANVLLVCRLR